MENQIHLKILFCLNVNNLKDSVNSVVILILDIHSLLKEILVWLNVLKVSVKVWKIPHLRSNKESNKLMEPLMLVQIKSQTIKIKFKIQMEMFRIYNLKIWMEIWTEFKVKDSMDKCKEDLMDKWTEV